MNLNSQPVRPRFSSSGFRKRHAFRQSLVRRPFLFSLERFINFPLRFIGFEFRDTGDRFMRGAFGLIRIVLFQWLGISVLLNSS
jgi:hypothetical protein